MTTLQLTTEDIQQDIDGFQVRIQTAKQKLSALSETSLTYKDRKKIKTKRQRLLSEITHVKGLICLAKEALREC